MKKKIIICFNLLLFCASALLMSCANKKNIKSDEIQQKNSFNPQTIKSADFSIGEKNIILEAGEYKINFDLKDGVSVIGAGIGKTILRPEKRDKPVITKSGTGKISNLSIIDGGDNWDCNGLYLTNSNAEVSGCEIKKNKFSGIYASFFSGKIINCIIEENEFDGIKLYNCQNALIFDNIIKNNNDDGIQSLHSYITIDSNLYKAIKVRPSNYGMTPIQK